MSRTMLRTVGAACALTGLVAAVSACSSSNSGTASSAASASSSASTAASASASPSAVAAQLTGTQIAALLPAASAYPSGYSVQADSTSNSGSSLETAAAKYSLTGMSCADAQTYLNDKGFGESAFATSIYASSNADYQATAYQFADAATAKTFYTSVVSAVTVTCGKASFTEDGSTIKINSTTVATPSGVTADSVIDTHQVVDAGGTTSTGNTLVALKGDDVVILTAGGVGSPEPTTPSLAGLTQTTLTKLSAGA